MAKKAKPNPFTGRWRIVSMSVWDQEFVDEEEEGYCEFDQKNNGSSTSATFTDKWTAA